jgi:MFS family permease
LSVATARLGLRANAGQFSLLVALNALVGAMVGLERSVLPLVGERDFDVASKSALLAFIVAFGAAKAVSNLAAGAWADRVGRKRLLVLGWMLALPVPILVGLAPSWGFIIAANVLLGANQGLAWSMTVVMKIDLVGPRRRGFALGLNESAGYVGLAVTAFATGALAASFAPRTVVWAGAAVVTGVGLMSALLFVRDTEPHVEQEQLAYGVARRSTIGSALLRGTVRDPVLRSCSQAGLVNNLNDAVAWGLVPLYLAAHGAGVGEIGLVAGVYPAVWGLGQLATGWLSDLTGRKPPIVLGMLLQACALALLAAGGGAFEPALGAAVLLGVGTALVYPVLLAAVSDAAQPVERAQLVGVYRFWRDFGFVAGALLAGVVADAASMQAAIATVAGLTGVSGLVVGFTRGFIPGRRRRRTVAGMLEQARSTIGPRLSPEEAAAAVERGALLVDIRSQDERRREGVVPGSLHIPRNVLEWRFDPSSGFANPHVGTHERELVVFCREGFSSSLAAATLRELGWMRATDVAGGFAAWQEAGLPVREASGPETDPAGMGGPEAS